MRLTILLSFLLAVPVLGQSTGTIVGRVVDQRTGVGLEEAYIFLDGVDIGVQTDSSGAFQIDRVSVGHHLVTATTAWHSQVLREVEILPNRSASVQMSLFPGLLIAYELPIVHGCRTSPPRVVTQDDITNLPIQWVNVSGRIAGIVTDTETGEPLPGANVILEGTNLGAVTGLDGRYRIDAVPIGTYTVSTRFIAYNAAVHEDLEILNNTITSLHIALQVDHETWIVCAVDVCDCYWPVDRDPFATRIFKGRNEGALGNGCDCGTIDLASFPVGR